MIEVNLNFLDKPPLVFLCSGTVEMHCYVKLMLYVVRLLDLDQGKGKAIRHPPPGVKASVSLSLYHCLSREYRLRKSKIMALGKSKNKNCLGIPTQEM